MDKKLGEKLDILQNDKRRLLKSLDPNNDDLLNYKPFENKWSITQIIFHLVKSEHLSIISIKKFLQKDTGLNAGFKSSINSVLLKTALKSPFKFSAPAIVAKVPETYSFVNLTSKWDTLRIDLEELLKNFSNGNLNRIVFRHPYSGDFNINQTMDFLIDHFYHHSRQIRKIDAAYNSNKGKR
jgi:hypothetical protein